MEQLRISENHRYLMQGDHPFFWLGDTAWLMLQKLNKEETITYLRNRKEKGYNVIQTVLMHILPGKESESSLAPGVKDVTKEEYWLYVDEILKLAEEMGMYIGLLPCWGSIVKDGTMNLDNIDEYAHKIGKRFQERTNIIWILGGDVRGSDGYDVFNREAEILRSYNPERLMTYHPFGRTSSSLWFHDQKWLDFNMFQSGHRRYDQASLGEWDDNAMKEDFYGEDCWKYIERDHGYPVMKPVIDGEPSYEAIPKGLHNPRNGFWEAKDVRRYAYWNLFEGAAGHTYGSNAIMQFYNEYPQPGAYGVRESWLDAMHHPGAGQMQYLKRLFESVDFVNGVPRDDLLTYGQKERYHRIAVFAGDDYLFAYTYSGDEFGLNLKDYADKTMDVYWMNPQDGTESYVTTLCGVEKYVAKPVRRREDVSNDWVLILRKA
ncbi:MAG: glycoside hydrolase family 140 protein [Lachnospiraceae bacterium]|nr:glycoside hydrolase family 140 protein [Lachnospiraceae bacterium]